jgi:Leucine-rich repeat (LRR) protein
MSDQPQVHRWHRISLNEIMILIVLFSLPFAIWNFKKIRLQQFEQAATPLENSGAADASNPESLFEFLVAYLFLGADHLVTSISFMDEPITDRQLESLRDDLRTLPKLNRILLENTKITDAGLSSVSELVKLNCLRLDGTAVTDAGVTQIRRLTQMRELGLARTNVTDACVVDLREMSRLRSLHLSDTQITDNGLAALKEFTNLEFLSLRNTAVTDEGLASVSSLAKMETLDLGKTKITDAWQPDLMRLSHLRGLCIDRTQLSEEGITQLKLALPDRQVWDEILQP